MEELEKMYTTTEAGKAFGVTRQTILIWINRGVIKAVMPNGNYRIPKSEIERVLKGE